jgi:hypothetical protein
MTIRATIAEPVEPTVESVFGLREEKNYEPENGERVSERMDAPLYSRAKQIPSRVRGGSGVRGGKTSRQSAILWPSGCGIHDADIEGAFEACAKTKGALAAPRHLKRPRQEWRLIPIGLRGKMLRVLVVYLGRQR